MTFVCRIWFIFHIICGAADIYSFHPEYVVFSLCTSYGKPMNSYARCYTLWLTVHFCPFATSMLLWCSIPPPCTSFWLASSGVIAQKLCGKLVFQSSIKNVSRQNVCQIRSCVCCHQGNFPLNSTVVLMLCRINLWYYSWLLLLVLHFFYMTGVCYPTSLLSNTQIIWRRSPLYVSHLHRTSYSALPILSLIPENHSYCLFSVHL